MHVFLAAYKGIHSKGYKNFTFTNFFLQKLLTLFKGFPPIFYMYISKCFVELLIKKVGKNRHFF